MSTHSLGFYEEMSYFLVIIKYHYILSLCGFLIVLRSILDPSPRAWRDCQTDGRGTEGEEIITRENGNTCNLVYTCHAQ